MDAELSAESVKLIAEFENGNILDLKVKLKRARQQALKSNATVEVSKAMMREAVAGVADSRKKVTEVAGQKNLLKDFLEELVTTSGLNQKRIQILLRNALEQSIQKGLDIDEIKQKLLRLARECWEDVARQIAKEREQLRLKSIRTEQITKSIDEAVEQFPGIDRQLIAASVGRAITEATSVEG